MRAKKQWKDDMYGIIERKAASGHGPLERRRSTGMIECRQVLGT